MVMSESRQWDAGRRIAAIDSLSRVQLTCSHSRRERSDPKQSQQHPLSSVDPEDFGVDPLEADVAPVAQQLFEFSDPTLQVGNGYFRILLEVVLH